MTLDEAYTEAVSGQRLRCDLMPEGSYFDYPEIGGKFYRNFWDEDNRCIFNPSNKEKTADWYIMAEGWGSYD